MRTAMTDGSGFGRWPAAVAMAALTGAMLTPGGLAAAPVGIQVVTGTLDFGAAEGSTERNASIKLLENFPAAPAIVYLDVNIAPAVTDPSADEKVLNFSATLYGSDGQPREGIPCALGASQMIDRGNARLSIEVGPLYTHMLLDVEIAPGSVAPYNGLSCDYAPGLPSEVSLRLTGFFVVQDTMVPTARGVRLVPITPPLAEALEALAKSHADP